jgi:nitrogen fixation NifU-like protein
MNAALMLVMMNCTPMARRKRTSGVGVVGNPVCGDLMQIKVDDGILTDVKFKTFGCGAAIATSSMVTDLAIGKTIEEALKITRNDVAESLEGLPPVKMHCSNLAADALHAAIEDYLKKEGRGEWFNGTKKSAKKMSEKRARIGTGGLTRVIPQN